MSGTHEGLYAARFANALKAAEYINKMLDAGYVIHGDEGAKVYDCRINSHEIVMKTDDGNVILYLNDKEFDNGALTKIGDFNSQFDSWTMIAPHDVLNFRLQMSKEGK